MESYILLENICFFAYHGVAQQETFVGNEFILNLKLKVDITQAMETDDISQTVNYAAVFQAAKTEIEIPSQLLEHVCGRILKRLFREFPSIQSIDIKLQKRNPPMGADIESAGVEIHTDRRPSDTF